MRIVITGASGNVGSAALLALGAEGPHELVGVSRRTPPQVPPYSWAEWAPIDIADLDAADRLQPVFAGADAVIPIDMAANFPRLDTTRLRSLDWSPIRDSREVSAALSTPSPAAPAGPDLSCTARPPGSMGEERTGHELIGRVARQR